MAITICGYLFRGPFNYPNSLENRSGVYVILGRNNKVIDVGESHQVRRHVSSDHQREGCWSRHGGIGRKYAARYVGKIERMQIEKLIRSRHNPPCGKI